MVVRLLASMTPITDGPWAASHLHDALLSILLVVFFDSSFANRMGQNNRLPNLFPLVESFWRFRWKKKVRRARENRTVRNLWFLGMRSDRANFRLYPPTPWLARLCVRRRIFWWP
ncbi:hypothetical protein F4818DRAFT_4225 [Hypoxylon cercidicola]|nr:hypothetical protein F4818DRAFT_4225 [Hypoxylon cercidicola]